MIIDRKFTLVGSNFINCNLQCKRVFCRFVDGNKIKELGDQTKTVRCVASGAALRGQRFGIPEVDLHTNNNSACRICTIYNSSRDSGQNVDSETTQSVES